MAITWTNETRKLSDLQPWPRNPRQIRQKQAKRLIDSVDTFGQVETLAVGPNGEVYNGHQRLQVLKQEHGADFEVDVRVASRPLTEKEREKLTVYLHKGAAGEWDFDTLANEFEVDELLDWGFEAFEIGIGDDIDTDYYPGESDSKGYTDYTFSIPSDQVFIVDDAIEKARTEGAIDKNDALLSILRQWMN